MSALAFHAPPDPIAWPAEAEPPRFYDAPQTAARVGLGVDRFRKVRADWTRNRDFPAEINEPGEPIRYLAAAVDRWVERRSRRVHAVQALRDPPHSREGAAAAPGDRAAASHGRARLRSLKGDA